MHPYILELVARERMADMHATAANYRLKREAAAGRAARKSRTSRSVSDRVELTWPDGVSSVVELPQQSAPAHSQGRGLAGSRR